MNITVVGRPTIETILEEEARDPEFGYASDFIIDLGRKQPHIVAFAKDMALKIPADHKVVLTAENLARLEVSILLAILVPVKGIYNQYEIDDFDKVWGENSPDCAEKS